MAKFALNTKWKTTNSSVIEWFEARGLEYAHDTGGEYFVLASYSKSDGDFIATVASVHWESRGARSIREKWNVYIEDRNGEVTTRDAMTALQAVRIVKAAHAKHLEEIEHAK